MEKYVCIYIGDANSLNLTLAKTYIGERGARYSNGETLMITDDTGKIREVFKDRFLKLEDFIKLKKAILN